jgi:hypothetical protein
MAGISIDSDEIASANFQPVSETDTSRIAQIDGHRNRNHFDLIRDRASANRGFSFWWLVQSSSDHLLWVILFNGFVGLACAIWYLRAGIGAAILVHFGTDLVWHVLSQLV